ncbi:MAG: hypothetical protein WCZ23_03050 [Rhodospirillaceae bacterium]
MLRKMILQGLLAAALIGGASALYAATAGADLAALPHQEDRDHD